MPKKAVKSKTQGRKNKELKMHIDLTGSNECQSWIKALWTKVRPPKYLFSVDGVVRLESV